MIERYSDLVVLEIFAIVPKLESSVRIEYILICRSERNFVILLYLLTSLGSGMLSGFWHVENKGRTLRVVDFGICFIITTTTNFNNNITSAEFLGRIFWWPLQSIVIGELLLGPILGHIKLWRVLSVWTCESISTFLKTMIISDYWDFTDDNLYLDAGLGGGDFSTMSELYRPIHIFNVLVGGQCGVRN